MADEEVVEEESVEEEKPKAKKASKKSAPAPSGSRRRWADSWSTFLSRKIKSEF